MRGKSRRRLHGRLIGAAVAASAAAAFPSAALALTAVTPEFDVNTTESGVQTSPDTAIDANGNFVVVWQSSGQDGDSIGVFYRLYNFAGQPLTGELQANTTTVGAQDRASVGRDAAGNFVIAWRSFKSTGAQDGDQGGIFARRFDAAGNPVSGEIPVNTTTAGDQDFPSVGVDADGDVAVAWESSGQDGNLDGVFARRFDKTGAPTTAELPVNVTTAGNQNAAQLAMNGAGDFVVAWRGDNMDGSLVGVGARRFSASGATSNEIDVNTTTDNLQTFPDVAIDSLGGFVVAWQSSGQDGDGNGVYARRFDETLAPVTGEVQASTQTAGSQEEAAVAIDDERNFTVAWTRNPNSLAAEDLVFVRRFAAAGAPLSEDVPVNTVFDGVQRSFTVANTAAGDFVVVWSTLDSSSDGVAGRRFDVPRPPPAEEPPPTDTGGGTPPATGESPPANPPGGTQPPPATTLLAGACANVKAATAGKDALNGTEAGDLIRGLAGDDALNGLAGDDCLFGGAGNDKLSGGAGNDRLTGDKGNDVLTGGPGKDALTGGAGDDKLSGGAGNDSLSGGSGDDTISGGAGKNKISGGAGNDTIDTRDGKAERVDCGKGRDRVRADPKDTLKGCERVRGR